MNMRETPEFAHFHLPIRPGTMRRGENKDELFPWQILGAVFLLHCHRFYGYATLADEMGVGKVYAGAFSLTLVRRFSLYRRCFTSMPNSKTRGCLISGLRISCFGNDPPCRLDSSANHQSCPVEAKLDQRVCQVLCTEYAPGKGILAVGMEKRHRPALYLDREIIHAQLRLRILRFHEQRGVFPHPDTVHLVG